MEYESAFAQTTIPTNIHTVNRIFTNIILMANTHNIPKGKMHSTLQALTRSDPGMSLNCAPTWVCRKSAPRPGYVVKVRTDPGYVVKQCPRIVMNKIFDWH